MSTTALVDAFKAEHPDAFQAIYDSGVKSGKAEMAAKPAKVNELKAAFPAHNSFVIDQLTAEATLEQATAAFVAVQAKDLSDAKAENEKIVAELTTFKAEKAKATALASAAHPQTEGFAGVNTGAPNTQTVNAKVKFENRVSELSATHKISRAAAVNRVSVEDPALYQAMLDEVNTSAK